MLRSTRELTGYALDAQDGPIGKCIDFLFDEESWTIRYMVADTRKWLPGHKVLVSPISLLKPNWNTRRLPVLLTKAQLKSCPPLDEDAPVSRQYEAEWSKYYGYGLYWTGPGIWGDMHYPAALVGAGRRLSEENASGNVVPDGDQHLRSVKEVTGYHTQAIDGEMGHVDDFLIDDVSWQIHYVVLDTRNWLPGRKVVISPNWVESVVWAERKVHVTLPRTVIKNSPEYEPGQPLTQVYEARLLDFTRGARASQPDASDRHP